MTTEHDPTGATVAVADPPEPDHAIAELVEERTAPLPAVVPPAAPPAPPSALESAAEELLATPGAPGRDEFLVLATTARILCMSAGAPAAIRNNPWLAFHLALIGRDLGISPSAALQQIDVIGYDPEKADPYANVQLSMSPELLNGQIKRLGLGRIVPGERTPTSCEAVAQAPDGEVLGSYTFDWQEAQQAQLVDKRCEGPFDHWTNPNAKAGEEWKNTNRCKCRQGYRTYPKRMLWWRAAGYAAADYFPEASIGLYAPEELGAVVGEDGRPVDPATVNLPEGFEEPPAPPPPPSEDVVKDATDDTDPALAADARDLTARIDAVKAAGDEAVAALRDMWEQTDEEGRRKTPPWRSEHFRRRHLTRARAVVKSVEDKVKRGEWGDEAKQAWADATVTGAGFGKGSGGAAVTAEDFDTKAGKSPQQLARERRQREQAAATEPAGEAAADAVTGNGTGEPQGGGDPVIPAEGDEEPLTAPESDATPDVEATPPAAEEEACEACGARGGATHDQALHDMADAVAAARGGRPPIVEEVAPGPDDDTLTDCLGCGKEIKRKPDGSNHPGPNGRAPQPHRSYHRSCAPFD